MSKLARALAGDDPHREALMALAAAYEAHVKLKLEPVKTSIANATIMTAAIEYVGEDLIISQPVIGGVTRPLLTGEQLRLSFSLKELGHVTGETEVVGRFKIPSGGGEPLHGYRLTIPDELFPDERRESGRAGGSVNLAREVEIYRRPGEDPIRGVVQNLSKGGMQIRTHDSPETPLRSGERVRLIVHLPPPVGGINRMVTIARLAGNRNPRHRVIGIAFEHDIPGLVELLQKTSNAA
ncbi:MAG: PilZ domain-containing protein [Phycisphaerales bacterium]